jgi:hypothetical protein
LPIPSGVFWEEISERSIKIKKPVGTIKTKDCKGDKSKPESRAAPASDPLLTASDDDEEPEEVMMIEIPWMQQYLAYLVNKELPKDPIEARRIARRSKAFTVIKGELYKRSISGVLQRCVTPDEGKVILKDIHEGICGHHASSRAIAAKAFRVGFYWITAVQDAKDIMCTCDACQRFASKPHAPAAELKQIPLAWPFA